MPRFSDFSKANIETLDQRLQDICAYSIAFVDLRVLEGHRGRDRQIQLFMEGKSKVTWPDSRHNSVPSLAMDLIVCPIDWKDRERATLFAGFILGVGASMGVQLVWGGDWNRDWQVKDNNFDDLWHFQISPQSLVPLESAGWGLLEAQR